MMSALDQFWGDVEERSFGEVPDNSYQVSIEEATINHAKSSGRLQCSWVLNIESPTNFKGRKLFKHDGLDNEDSLGWFRGGLARLGIDWPASPRELPGVLEGLKGSYALVVARTKKDSDIQNVHFKKALDSTEIDTTEAGSADIVEEEAPAEEPPVEGDAEEPIEGDAPAEEATGVNVSFDDTKISPPIKKRIEALATKLTFNVGDYSTSTDLLCDVAEYVGVVGDYAQVMPLLAEAEKGAVAMAA